MGGDGCVNVCVCLMSDWHPCVGHLCEVTAAGRGKKRRGGRKGREGWDGVQDAGQRLEVRKSEGAEAAMRGRWEKSKLESRRVSAGGHD